MVNFKKIVAVGVVATMLMSSNIVAFAEGEPVTEGSQDGTGANEGHVDKAVVDVVLPTTTDTTFAYTMDPERLITATEAAKYAEGTTFPEDDDTGVYFLTGEKTYANASNTVQVINKGAVEQKVTVKAKLTASAGGKDIAVLSAAPAADAQTAGLYLKAEVAGVSKALSTTEAEWYLKVPGNDDNYEVAVSEGAYVYQKKTTGLTAWKAADITVSGAVTNGIAVASDTTAPKITVSWKFENVPATNDTTTYESATFTDFSDTPATPPTPEPTAVNACSASGNKVYVKLLADSSAVTTSTVTSVKVDDQAVTDYTISASGVISIPNVASGAHTILVTNAGTVYTGSVTVQ